jgi:glycosyltransferase involved in cell wall biosynthesis
VRVCFLIDRLTTAGTETQLLALIRRLDRRRVRPYLCLLRGESDESRALEPTDCPVLRLGAASLRHPGTFVRAWRFARFLRRERIDVVQTYFPDSTYFGVPAAWLAGVPRIARTRNNLGYWMTPWHRRMGRLCNWFTDVLVANCEAARRAVIVDEGLPAARVIVLENGVDLARFPLGVRSTNSPLPRMWGGGAEGEGRAPREGPVTSPQPLSPEHGREEHCVQTVGDLRNQTATRRVGVVANLRPVKGLDNFVRAASALARVHPEVTFLIAGEGALRPELERLAAERGLGERFVLVGTLADVPGFLAGLDVAALPSRSEGMSNALLEYMAAGKAIVATAVGGNPRLIDDGVHGLLVPSEDPGALATAISRLLSDADLATQLGLAARRRVEERYSREAMVRRFELFYWRLMGSIRRS